MTLVDDKYAFFKSVVSNGGALNDLEKAWYSLAATGTVVFNEVQAGSFAEKAIDKIVSSTSNLVDLFVYDTTKDSDEGAWRKKVQHTSWYNETLSTATRGSKREFPKVSLIVVEATKVTIYDLTDPDVPMWRVTNRVGPSGSSFWRNSPGIEATSVAAKDGVVIFGLASATVSASSGLCVMDFVSDKLSRYSTTNASCSGLSITDDTSTTATMPVITPEIVNEDVNDVAITTLSGAETDPNRCGLPYPTIAAATDGGVSVINHDGSLTNVDVVVDLVDVSGDDANGVMVNEDGDVFMINETQGDLNIWRSGNYTADSTTPDTTYDAASTPALLENPANNDGFVDLGGDVFAVGGSSGVTVVAEDTATPANGMVAYVTKDYNSLWQWGDIIGCWLCNSVTADRSVNGITATQNGTVPETVFATGGEFKAYGPYTGANNVTVASNSQWDTQGTGVLVAQLEFQSSGNSTVETLLSIANAGNTVRYNITMDTDGTIDFTVEGATASDTISSTVAYDDGQTHEITVIQSSSTSREMWIDSVQIGTSTTDTGSISDTGNLPLGIGVDADGSSNPALTTLIGGVRLSKTVPSDAQIRKMYFDHRPLFRDNAGCLISGTSNAVTDLSFDSDTRKLDVATGDGTSTFIGLERVDYIDSTGTQTSDNMVAVDRVDDVVALANDTEVVVDKPVKEI